MASNTKKMSNFDKLPVVVQFLIGLILLFLIAAIGFGVFFLVDIVLLDLDPIAKIVTAISAAVKG